MSEKPTIDNQSHQTMVKELELLSNIIDRQERIIYTRAVLAIRCADVPYPGESA